MTRICCVTHHYYPQHAHIRRDMETLAEAGYDVDIICLRRKGQKGAETIDGVHVYRLPVEHKRLGLFRNLSEYSTFVVLASMKLAFLHLRKRYAVIEVNNMPDFLVFTTVLPKMLGAKVILYVFDNMPEDFAFKHGFRSSHPAIRLLRWCERISTAYADRVIVTQNSAKRVLESHGVQSSKMSVVVNVPNEGIFYPVAMAADAQRKGRFRVMTHASIIYNYGIQTIIRAIPLLVDQIPGLEVQIVGEGEYLGELVKLAHDLEVEERVEFTGYVPHKVIPQMISEADVGVITILNDLMLPSKLFEYVAMAKPVIVTAQPTMKEYFDDDSAVFYEPDSENDLARCLSALYRNPQQMAALAQHGMAIYEKYRWSRSKYEYLHVYERLAKVGKEHHAGDGWDA